MAWRTVRTFDAAGPLISRSRGSCVRFTGGSDLSPSCRPELALRSMVRLRIYEDAGISGSNGRDKRPGLERQRVIIRSAFLSLDDACHGGTASTSVAGQTRTSACATGMSALPPHNGPRAPRTSCPLRAKKRHCIGHSIILSARSTNSAGSSRPIAFAILRLTTKLEIGRLLNRDIHRFAAKQDFGS